MRDSTFLLPVKAQFFVISASLLAGSVNPAAGIAVALMVGPPAIKAASFEIPHGFIILLMALKILNHKSLSNLLNVINKCAVADNLYLMTMFN